MVTVDKLLGSVYDFHSSFNMEIVNLHTQYYEYDEDGNLKLDEDGIAIAIKNVNEEATQEQINVFLDFIYYFFQEIKHPLLDENKRMMIEEPKIKWVPEDYE